MCLGIPMQVIRTEGMVALCEARGVEREVSLFLLQDEAVEIGDYLVMQGGYATGKISAEAARAAWEIYDQMLHAET